MVGWLRTYKIKQYLLPDILAGASVAALVVPQGMSYAGLAGLPAVYGLYGAFVPVLCYAALGSSRHLAVGPVAVTSLLLGSGIPNIIDAPIQDNPNNPRNQHAQDVYNHAAIQVAFLAGCLYTAVGILELGWLTNFLSHSVISGFMSGASVIIALSQLPQISFPRHDPVQEQLKDLFGPTWTPYWQWREFLMGACWLILLFTMKEVGKRNKRLVYVRAAGPLTVTVLSIAISNIFKLYQAPYNIKTVGVVPAGLPHQTVTWWFPFHDIGRFIGLAIKVCAIDVLESISIAKALAYRNQYELNATQELRGLGLANLVGAAFNCYTTTGSFSRSAIMNDVGAKTQLAGITSGVIVMIVLLCLTPVFRNMPQNAQGAVIIAAVVGLFNYEEWWFLLRVNFLDWVVFNVALLTTMFAGVDLGLGISIGLSIVLALYKSAFPKTSVLGQLPETSVFRNVKQYPEAREVEGMLLLRVDAPLYFANVNPVKDALYKYERRAKEIAAAQGRSLHFIIIDLSPVNDIDASAVHFFKDWVISHKRAGIQPVISNPSRQIMRLLEKAHIPEIIGEEYITVRMADAVAVCQVRSTS
ncbi:sulfate permease [Coccomyxa subellipsoidea C-169]|uniref:Sulfate permease n=1 Tax=Coccomyxa subellipsoidea (strain C-169) TaxID=574566 RepID=I0Z509_COCSC|nr:sulfate permease [Coccomyxa subellipsoidea C-169]EIE25728.1 sulfate permease [Coccomyxa subellipsoidea C-169]|eukprot:XP_005650272.1 sulfate permease [Coccomyxa subellipsoidea C-169]